MPRRQSSNRRHIHVFSRVKLERRLGAPDLEVDLGVRVVCRHQLLHGEPPRVDGAFRREDEAVVDVGLAGAKGEGRVVTAREVGEGRWGGGGGDAAFVEGEVGVGGDTDLGTFDCRRGGEIEVAAKGGKIKIK